MTAPTLLDAWENIAWSDTLLTRLRAAAEGLAQKPGFADEKRWLETAVDRVERARTGLETLQSRAMVLPELAPLLEAHAAALQAAAIDAVERLQAGIAFHAGSRSPLLEALYGRAKLPALRRAERLDFEAFCRDFEKRLGSGYARRMLADGLLQPVGPAVAKVQDAVAAWRAAWSPVAPGEPEARALRDELAAAGARLELPLKQARLLAEAALSPLRGAFEESGLGQRPKRRGGRLAEFDPAAEATVAAAPAVAPAPDAPTSEELAELEALRAAGAPSPPASRPSSDGGSATLPGEAAAADEAPEARPSPPAPPSPRRRRARAASAPSVGQDSPPPESSPSAP